MVRSLRKSFHHITDISNIYTGQPCDADGYDLPMGTPPTPQERRADDDYFPYSSRPEFELADLLFRRVQMSGSKISDLMDIWAAYQQIYDVDPTYGPPFASSQDLYNTIDSTEIGDVAWQAFTVEFDGRFLVRVHHGRGSPLRSGSEILLRLPKLRSLTKILLARWIMHPSGCLAGQENVSIPISCRVIGHGNRL